MIRHVFGVLRRRWIFWGILFLPCLASAAVAEETRVFFTGGPHFVEEGGNCTVALQAVPAVPVAGIQVDVVFDPTHVEITGVQEGDFFKGQGYSTYFVPGTIDNDQGRLSQMVGVITTPGGETGQAGVIAEIAFMGKTAGTAALTIAELVIGNKDGAAVAASAEAGEIRITAADADDDGIPDVWEETHGLNSAFGDDALEDRNADGESNINEYKREFLSWISGADPELERAKWDVGGDGRLTLAEAVCALQAAAGLRQAVLSDADSESSAALDAEDADNDGMPDAWETDRGLNPQNAQDALADRDADGVSNIQECLREAWLAKETTGALEARTPWDVGGDGIMGLAEAVQALQVAVAN